MSVFKLELAAIMGVMCVYEEVYSHQNEGYEFLLTTFTQFVELPQLEAVAFKGGISLQTLCRIIANGFNEQNISKISKTKCLQIAQYVNTLRV